MSRAIEDVIAERRRQVEHEGWTPEHDDRHDSGEMLQAAKAYFAHAIGRALSPSTGDRAGIPHGWPWEPEWWKPKSPREDLVRAGALTLAEMDRIRRAYTTRVAHRYLDAKDYYRAILTEIERIDRAAAEEGHRSSPSGGGRGGAPAGRDGEGEPLIRDDLARWSDDSGAIGAGSHA